MAATTPSTADPRPSPDPDQAPSPSSPSPPELSPSALAPSPAPAAAAQRHLLSLSAAPGRLPPPPPCWGHDETLALIEAYREKWYKLRRGNLRASHWQEVADAVRRRCRRLAAPKTAVQCRHKVEKLRQRYRAEKQRLALRGNASKPRSSSWDYFSQMEAMEVGATAALGAAPPPSSDDVNGGHSNSGGNTKTPHALRLGFNGVVGGAGLELRIPKGSRSKVVGHNGALAKPKPDSAFINNKGGGFWPRSSEVEARGEGGGGVEERRKGGLVWEMAAAVKMLGEEFTRVEEMKMEVARDMGKLWREMELKRTELIVQSQRQLVDYIRGLRRDRKRAKVSPESSL